MCHVQSEPYLDAPPSANLPSALVIAEATNTRVSERLLDKGDSSGLTNRLRPVRPWSQLPRISMPLLFTQSWVSFIGFDK